MSEFFDFLHDVLQYRDNATVIKRLNQRHKLIVEPFVPQIIGARVLDLGCHDGRWSYALAAAGASEVVGVEARPELIAKFDHYPDAPYKSRVSLTCSDIFDDLEGRAARGERFDIVTLYGIFYHVMDHLRLLRLITRLQPRLIIIDSEFIVVDNAMIQILKEKISNPLNAIPNGSSCTKSIVGVPSKRATEFMAEVLAYDVVWIDHALILGDDHRGMHDYFRTGRKVRHTCALVPIGSDPNGTN